MAYPVKQNLILSGSGNKFIVSAFRSTDTGKFTVGLTTSNFYLTPKLKPGPSFWVDTAPTMFLVTASVTSSNASITKIKPDKTWWLDVAPVSVNHDSTFPNSSTSGNANITPKLKPGPSFWVDTAPTMFLATASVTSSNANITPKLKPGPSFWVDTAPTMFLVTASVTSSNASITKIKPDRTWWLAQKNRATFGGLGHTEVPLGRVDFSVSGTGLNAAAPDILLTSSHFSKLTRTLVYTVAGFPTTPNNYTFLVDSNLKSYQPNQTVGVRLPPPVETTPNNLSGLASAFNSSSLKIQPNQTVGVRLTLVTTTPNNLSGLASALDSSSLKIQTTNQIVDATVGLADSTNPNNYTYLLDSKLTDFQPKTIVGIRAQDPLTTTYNNYSFIISNAPSYLYNVSGTIAEYGLPEVFVVDLTVSESRTFSAPTEETGLAVTEFWS